MSVLMAFRSTMGKKYLSEEAMRGPKPKLDDILSIHNCEKATH